MAQTRTIARSFAGGIISAEVHGRIDLGKFQTGLQQCENFIVLPQGPVQRRTGFQFVNRAKVDQDSRVVLIPFSYNNDQTYAIEVGHEYMWFHTDGGTLLATPQSITAVSVANPGVFTIVGHGFTTGRVVYLAGITGGMAALNGAYYRVTITGVDTFTLTDMDANVISTLAYGAYSGPGTAALVVEVTTPYATGDLRRIHYVQSADVLTLVHPGYPPAELRRLSATSWSYTVIDFDPPDISGLYGGSLTPYRPGESDPPPGTAILQQYKVTVVDANGMESEPGLPLTEKIPPGVTSTFPTAPGIEIDTITQANPGVITTAAAHGRIVGEPIIIRPNPLCGMPEIANRELFVSTVPTATTLTLEDETGTPVDTTGYTAYTGTTGGLLAGPHALMLAGVYNDLTLAGNYNLIRVTLQTDYIGRVYKNYGGIYGFIGETETGILRDYDIVPATGIQPPMYDELFTGANNYPRAVTYHEQRRWFGGTNAERQSVWASRSGTESDFTFHTPTQDDDRINIRMAARQANTVEHLVALDELLALTLDSEFRIDAATGEAIVPSNIRAKPQSYVGASRIQPVTTNASVLYPSARSDSMREFSFSFDSNKYESRDVSILAPHLFRRQNIFSLTYQRDPQQILWAVRSDGALLGFTYVPEQDIRAWHIHTTDGVIESCCAIADGNDDSVYVVVQRTVDGIDRRYIERLKQRIFDEQADYFFVDSGATYDGVPATTITGLAHLEGETVAILADGAVLSQQVVIDGAITLEEPASKVHVGLPFTSNMQTLPMYVEMEAFGQGNKKNIAEASFRLIESATFKAGPKFDMLRPVKTRTTEPLGTPPSTVDGRYFVNLEGLWNDDGSVCVRQSDPVPLTISQLVITVAIGG